MDNMKKLFEKRRWPLDVVLCWVCSREPQLTAEVLADSDSLARVQARLDDFSQPHDWRYRDPQEAWEIELVPRFSAGEISAFATAQRTAWDGQKLMSSPGVVFPPSENPGIAEDYIPEERDGLTILAHRKKGLHESVEYAGATFDALAVQTIWPAILTPKPKQTSVRSPTPLTTQQIQRMKAAYRKRIESLREQGKSEPTISEDDSWFAENYTHAPRELRRAFRRDYSPVGGRTRGRRPIKPR